MKILINMPLAGIWYTDTNRSEGIHPLPLPFNVSYYHTFKSIDLVAGSAVYEYDIFDDELTPALIAAINSFASVVPDSKRNRIKQLETELFDVRDPITDIVTRKTRHFGDIFGIFQKRLEKG